MTSDSNPPRRAITVRGLPAIRARPQSLRAMTVCEGAVRHWPLPVRGEVLIGRAAECGVIVDDPSVSRKHCMLRLDDEVSVTDLGSSNGTFFGTERLAPDTATLVPTGAALRLGAATLLLQEDPSARRLKHLHQHDYFGSRLEDELARLEAKGGELAIARLSFAGKAKAAVEEAIAGAVRSLDVVAVYAPSEYEILFPDTSAETAAAVCRAIEAQAALAHARLRFAVAEYPHDGVTPEQLEEAVSRPLHRGSAAPESPPPNIMEGLRPFLERIAPGKISILILGETGVGKEVLARAIHAGSPRRARPFLAVSCVALAESLLESELFGHERGAFTGAVRAKTGLLESADGGTIFLDEIGEVPAGTQAKLLRVIERREVTRLGSVKPKTIDVRFISATNRDLDELVQRGEFRSDLFFRLSAASVTVPPLRERVSEIGDLARSFLHQFCAEDERPTLGLSKAALAVLESYAWPGNIRELRNAIERSVLLCTGSTILPEHLPLERMGRTLPPRPQPGPLSEGRAPAASRRATTLVPASAPGGNPEDSIERQRIVEALESCGGNQSHAAMLLGISRGTLINRITRYQLTRPRKRE